MKEENWTEQQLINFVRDSGYLNFSSRQLKRFRLEKVVPRVHIEYLEVGLGTRTWYSPEAGPQILEICRLIDLKCNFKTIRFLLWLSGYSIELSILKQTIQQLFPPLSWKLPQGTQQKEKIVDQMTENMLQEIEGRSKHPLLSTLLRQISQKADRQSFMTIQASLLYGLRYEFASSDYSHVESSEETLSSTEIMEQGLQFQALPFFLKDMTADLNRLSSQGLLSFSKLNEALEQASEEDMIHAGALLANLDDLLECCGIMGYLTGPLLRFFQNRRGDILGQALFLVLLLLLKRSGYEHNMETIFTTVQAQLPALRRGQAIRIILQRELPAVTKELTTFQQIGQFKPQEQKAYMYHLSAMYEQNVADLEALWQRHPEWKEGPDSYSLTKG